ncbi:hypothetical protein ACMHYJ_01985 [Castellaniella hirudinis]|uniref:hypothetical protein n=1 Tax=Castellaniella hirudinis TaxID=1144617 RepID=UPI0039C1C470
MALLWTESFVGFGVDAQDTLADLRAAGYEVVGQGLDWRVRPDPIIPDRYALAAVATDTQESGSWVSFGRRLPDYTAPIVIGFGLHVPLNYALAVDDVQPLLQVFTHEFDDLSDVDGEVARVRRDGMVGLHTDAVQNTTRMRPGRTHYVEVRIALADVRVWIDDVFVLQHTVVNRSPRAWRIALHAGFDQRTFSLGNLYALNEAGEAPIVRLGRTTRIIGGRPADDIQATFERPVAAPSNASVAAQDLLVDPIDVLQGNALGDTDIYGFDIQAALTATPAIHGMMLKARGANIGDSARAIRVFADVDGIEDNTARPVAFQCVVPFTTADILCAVRVPGDALYVGTRSGQIWRSVDSLIWDGVASTLGGQPILAIAVRSTVLVAVCGDDTVLRCDTAVSDRWSVVSTPATAALRAIASSTGQFMAVGDDGCVITSYEGEAWVVRDAGITANLTTVIFTAGYWLISGAFTEDSMRASLNNGINWLVPTATRPLISSAIRIKDLGGRLLALGDGVDAVATRLALTGHDALWYGTTKLGNQAGSVEWRACAFTGNLYFLINSAGDFVISNDGIFFQHGGGLQISARDAVTDDAGRIVVVGDNGAVFIRQPMPAATVLPIGAGWESTYAGISINPGTQADWAAADIDTAAVGVQLAAVPVTGKTERYLLMQNGLRLLNQSGGKILL